MKKLLLLAVLCIACNPKAKTPVDAIDDEPFTPRQVVPEPPKFTIPDGASFNTYTVERYINIRGEDRYDTVQVRKYILDTAKVFLYKHKSEHVDTLILGNKSVSFRGNRAWGFDVTEFLQQKKFRVAGKDILIRKYHVFSGKSITNMFIVDSLGKVIETGIGHLSNDVGTVLYKEYRDIHNAIMKDSTFFKFE